MVVAVVQAAARDPNAMPEFEQVYDNERQGLTRLAFLMVGSAAVAEELVQDAFVALFENIHRVDNPGGFVRTTLVRRCLTWRGRRSMERDRLRLVGEPPLTGQHDIDEMWEALMLLRPERRAVLVLRYYADHTHEQIADLLGVKPATVRTRAHRGIADLRRELSE